MAPKQQEEEQLLRVTTATMVSMMNENSNNNISGMSGRGGGGGDESISEYSTVPATATGSSSRSTTTSTSTDGHQHHPRTIVAATPVSSTGAGPSSPSTATLSLSPLSPYNMDKQEEQEHEEPEEGDDAHGHNWFSTSPTTVMTPSSPSATSATATSDRSTTSINSSTADTTVKAETTTKMVDAGETALGVVLPSTPTGTNRDIQRQLPQQEDGKKDNLRNNRPKPQNPFFVFDDWLDDLVPKDQAAAEQLAELLRTPDEKQRKQQQKPKQQRNEPQRLSPILQFFFERFHRSDDCVVQGGSIVARCRAANRSDSSSKGLDRTSTRKHQGDDDDQRQRRISSEPMLSSMNNGRGRNITSDDDDDDDDGSIHSSPPHSLKVQQMPSTPKSSNKRRSILRRRGRRRRQQQQVDPEEDQQNDDEDGHYHCGIGDNDEEKDGEDEYNFYYESPIGTLPAPTRLEEQLDLASGDHHQAQQAAPPGVPVLDLGSREEDEELQRRHRNYLLRRRHRQKNPCIVRRSLELAQAWNLKGLQKAREASCRANEDNNGPSSPERSWEDALTAWNNALEIITALLGKRHVQYAMIQNNRGIALGRLELYDESFEALTVALEIRQSRLAVGRAVNNGSVSVSNGTGAVQTEEQIRRRTPEDGDSVGATNTRITTNNTSTFEEVVSTLHNLANVYQAKGDLPTALSVLGYARGLCIDAIEAENGKTASGSTEVATASTYSLQSARLCVAMGHVYWEASQYDDAHDAYQDAMQLYEHLSTETTRRNIINSRRNNNNKAKEEPHHYEVISAELQSLRVDIQELQGLREQQHCNYREQLMRQRQLEGHFHQVPPAGNFFPTQN